MDLYYGAHGYSTCVTQAGSLMKKQKRGCFSTKFSGIFIFIIDSYYRDLGSCISITKSFVI